MTDKRFQVPNCEEKKRRVSFGLLDYALWDNDLELNELAKPMFMKKRFVVWALDGHQGPVMDVRSIIEPLGVEFIEHTIVRESFCERMCYCNQTNYFGYENMKNLFADLHYPNEKFYGKILNDPIATQEIARADALFTSVNLPLIEFYMRFNQSIIFVNPVRMDSFLSGDLQRWRDINERLQYLLKSSHHLIGANNLYDVEYMHYFMGSRPDYVPGFCVYTGEHYRPVRQSFLYAKRWLPDRNFWDEQFDYLYLSKNATFKLFNLSKLYKSYEYQDLAAHLGIIHRPYQVSTNNLFNF